MQKESIKIYLLKAKDLNKDQSYFLSQISSYQLKSCLFPLGDITKPEVRAIAHKLDLESVEDKKDSTGVCFIGERNFKEFLKNYIPAKSGDIVDIDTNEVIGHHEGVIYYTIGQRKGLGIGGIKGLPTNGWFVCKKDVKKNILYVAFGEDKSSATSGNVKDTYEITIVDNLVKSIQLKTTEDYSVILGEKGATTLAYATVSDGKLAADAKGIYVEATYENGETSVLENTNMKFGTKADDITKTIADVSPTTAGTSTIYVEVSKLDAVVGFEKTSSCDVTAKENVIDDIKVTVGTVEAKDYRESAAEFKALFTVNGLYADDTNTGDAVAAGPV